MVQSDTNPEQRSSNLNKPPPGIQDSTGKTSAMTLVIKHLLLQPYTSAALVKKIGKYSPSHINNCLRKLRKAGLIGAVWDFRQVCLVYYNINLEKVSEYLD